MFINIMSTESEANFHPIPGHPIFGCQHILCILRILGTAAPSMVSAEVFFVESQLLVCCSLFLCSLIFLAPHFTVDLWNLIWSIWVTGKFVVLNCMQILCVLLNRLHHPIWNHGSEGVSNRHVFTTPTNTQEKQVLHVVGVHFPVLSDTGPSSSLGSLPL